MADQKITALTELTDIADGDMIPVVDDPTGSAATKKIQYQNLIDLDYGAFSSNADQTCTSGTTADAITYSDTDASNNVTLSDNSRINIANAGTYLITFSAVGKSAAPNKTLDIWFAVGGSPIARSNTVSKFVGSANERIITVTYIYTFTAGQYFELYMWSDDAGTKLEATGTQTNPTRPACPSIIITVNRISK